MTCYDCIHCEACSDAGDAGFSCLKEDVSKCSHFKNKADYTEVVRCGKCKHWIYWADSKTCSCEIHHIRTIRDDFCSYGERRDT